MQTPIRLAAPRSLALVVTLALGLSACAGSAAPTSDPPQQQSDAPAEAAATPTPGAANDAATRAAYTDQMCAIFERITALDPRIGSVRAVAAEGGDMTAEAAEMESLSESLLPIVVDLEALPDWGPGRALRHELLTSMHGIRATFLHVVRDPSAPDAADDVVGMPFIATDRLDRAMTTAREGGMFCEVPS